MTETIQKMDEKYVYLSFISVNYFVSATDPSGFRLHFDAINILSKLILTFYHIYTLSSFPNIGTRELAA